MSDSAESKELLDALTRSPGYLLATAARRLREQTSAVLEPFELSLNEYVVLRLVALKANLAQGALGSMYGIDPATTVSVIDRLEERKLVTRLKDPSDRRRHLLRTTPTGNKVLTRAKSAVTRCQNKFLSPLTENEWMTVRDALCRLLQLDAPC